MTLLELAYSIIVISTAVIFAETAKEGHWTTVFLFGVIGIIGGVINAYLLKKTAQFGYRLSKLVRSYNLVFQNSLAFLWILALIFLFFLLLYLESEVAQMWFQL